MRMGTTCFANGSEGGGGAVGSMCGGSRERVREEPLPLTRRRATLRSSPRSAPMPVLPLLALAWDNQGNQVGAVYGHAVTAAGDVDGDGYDDALVTANR